MEITLSYWNTLANQTLLISSLLSGFSIAIIANLLTSDKDGKIINRILKLSVISAGCFLVSVFAMTQITMITTPGGIIKNVTLNDFVIPRIIGFSTFMIGLITLTGIISLSGWIKSRKIGLFTTTVGIITLLLILVTIVKVNLGSQY